jgi:hypothetical protein
MELCDFQGCVAEVKINLNERFLLDDSRAETCAAHELSFAEDRTKPGCYFDSRNILCSICSSKGFEPSISGRGCTFCDGSFGGAQ